MFQIEDGSTNGDLTKVVNKLALQYIVDMQERATEGASSIETGQLVKTRLCYHYMSYGCLRGSRCKFAHGITDLRLRQPLMSDLLKSDKSETAPAQKAGKEKTAGGASAAGSKKKGAKGKREKANSTASSVGGQGITHILFPSELTGILRTNFEDGEKKCYDRRTMLIFQHMYVNPPPGLDLDWLSSTMKDLTFQWARSKRITKRRVSDAGLTGWRLHDENRAATNIDGAHGDEPEFGLPSENQLVHDKERRNSFPDVDILCATVVDKDWEEAVQSATKLPSTPGPGIKRGSNPFAFSNQEKMNHLKKALVKNAETNSNDTPILTFAQRLRSMS